MKPERQIPKQARSRQRYEHILNTAAALFEAEGLEAVSTNHIAAAANVSIGSLYQFFPNKEAIVESLMEGFLAEISAVFPEIIDTSMPVDSLVREILAQFIQFEREKTGFSSVFLGHDSLLHSTITAGIEHVLAAYYPALPTEKRQTCAMISLGITKGLMALPLPPEQLLNATHQAVIAYQTAFLQAEGIS